SFRKSNGSPSIGLGRCAQLPAKIQLGMLPAWRRRSTPGCAGAAKADCSPMGLEDIQRVFPSLTAGSYRITRPADPRYNCAAWAVRETHQWWDPEPGDGCYWPSNIP